MKCYYDMYVSDELIEKKSQILQRIEKNQAQLNKYIIVLSKNEKNLILQAHPFRSGMKLMPAELLDGIEVYNAGNEPEWNESARIFAEERGIPCIAGSDGHKIGTAGRAGIAASERIKSNEDLIRVLKNGEYEITVPAIEGGYGSIVFQKEGYALHYGVRF